MISSENTPIIVKAKKFSSNKDIIAHYKSHGWVSLKKFIPKKIISTLEADFDKVAFDLCGLKFEKAVIYLNKRNKDKLLYVYFLIDLLFHVVELISLDSMGGHN